LKNQTIDNIYTIENKNYLVEESEYKPQTEIDICYIGFMKYSEDIYLNIQKERLLHTELLNGKTVDLMLLQESS